MDRLKGGLHSLESGPVGGIGVIPLKPLGQLFRIERASLDPKQPVTRDFEAVTLRGEVLRLNGHVLFPVRRRATSLYKPREHVAPGGGYGRWRGSRRS